MDCLLCGKTTGSPLLSRSNTVISSPNTFETFARQNGVSRPPSVPGESAGLFASRTIDYDPVELTSREDTSKAQKRLADLIMQTGKVGHA